ncbi:MAG: response regulator [Clostridiales Family XIII bacterium]|jgi:DNA-binding NtrC family response regulator|nr:response regulator [Clostridiales Family XIII bacterium]
MSERLSVLIIESSKYSADLNVRELTRGGYEVIWERVENEAMMRRKLADGRWNVILADHSTPMFDSIAALAVKNELSPGTPFIIVSEDVSPEVIRRSMQDGCCAYLVRENLYQLAILVRKILESKQGGADTQGAAIFGGADRVVYQ